MKTVLLNHLACALVALCLVVGARGASVSPGTGYTNDFAGWPVAADWGTVSIAGGRATFTTWTRTWART